MPKIPKANERERMYLNKITCPICPFEWVSQSATRCKICGTRFAKGSLMGLRIPRHARHSIKPSWMHRFHGVRGRS